MLTSNEIRSRFLEFFKKRGHAVLGSASLITQDTSGSTNATLFNTAGMQPLVPYLLGEKHPSGDKLVNVQKCIRTVDLDEVGDNTHNTFFEMLGNWSLGSYFKQEAISWSYEFLTNKEEGLGLDPNRLYFTVFSGNEKISRDDESVAVWKSLGVPEDRIYYKNSKSNWWSAGPNSPAGPSTEMFYDVTGSLGDMNQVEFEQAEDAQKVVEIWNDVFMSYRQENGEVVGELPQKNVDTGAGMERTTMVVQGVDNIFDTDLFAPTMSYLKNTSSVQDLRAMRIVADHIRTSVFLIAEGVAPSNKDRGYILRRIIRRMIRFSDTLGLKEGSLLDLADLIIKQYGNVYKEIVDKKNDINTLILEEENQFRKTLSQGLREFEKGTDPFILFTTYGFPIELTEELARERGTTIDREEFDRKLAEHQKLSQTSSAGTFKGGLSDPNDPSVVKLHTAHHLLLAALQEVLGKEVKQRGSNITPERLRIDFSFDRKMTDEEKKKVEEIVNEKIQQSLPVIRKEMPREEAEKLGAQMEFGVKYPEIVSVYFIGDESTPFSIEFCGGPHITNTSELGTFKLQKEEASSQGIRRIKAVLL